MVKITLEYTSMDQAIVALGKLAALPVKANIPVAAVGAQEAAAPAASATRTRRVRADKGQARGPHGGVTTEVPRDTSNDTRELTPEEEKAFADAKAYAADNAARQALQDARKPVAPAEIPAPVPDADTQKVLALVINKCGVEVAIRLLSKFGVKRARELKPEQRAEFIEYAAQVEKTGIA